jgi:hypothetical protein
MSVKVNWLVTKNFKKSPLNPRVGNWPESCHRLMQCAGGAVWVFLLAAEQHSCCAGMGEQQVAMPDWLDEVILQVVNNVRLAVLQELQHCTDG